MDIYNYDKSSGEYINTSAAQASPLEPDVYLVPAHATTVAPPAPREGYARIWSGAAWAYVEDHRSQTIYYTSNAGAHIVTALGTIPEGCTTLVPPTYPVWSGSIWTFDLTAAKTAACTRIEAKRQTLERAGVTISWPDGTKSKIQTRDDRDWRNINGVASRGLARITQADVTPDWFRDADNVDHSLTPTQALDMGQQAATAISKLAKVAQAAKDAINASTVTTADQITAIESDIVWPEV